MPQIRIFCSHMEAGSPPLLRLTNLAHGLRLRLALQLALWFRSELILKAGQLLLLPVVLLAQLPRQGADLSVRHRGLQESLLVVFKGDALVEGPGQCLTVIPLRALQRRG